MQPTKPIDTIIINAAECEPYVTADNRCAVEEPKAVLEGIYAIKSILGVHRVIIAVENNTPDVIEVLTEIANNKEHDPDDEVRILSLESSYPQGAEKQLIYAITKRIVPLGKLPSDVGAIVNNVDTAVRLCSAITLGMPVITRVVTVSGGAVKNPQNLRVRIGTPFEELFNFCGGFTETPKKILMGGPMMGIAQHKLSVPVIKGTSGVLALTEKETAYGKETACIHCGRCANYCPMRILPSEIVKFVKANNFSEAKLFHAMDCMGFPSYEYNPKEG